MIESYTNTSQTIAPEGLLSFATNDVLTGCTVLHSAGSTSFTLKRPGFLLCFFYRHWCYYWRDRWRNYCKFTEKWCSSARSNSHSNISFGH